MSEKDNNSILDVLEMSRGYDTALLTTFNFEVEFFERAVLNRLIKNDIRRISVFVDSEELKKALGKVHNCVLGQRYAVNPVSIKEVF